MASRRAIGFYVTDIKGNILFRTSASTCILGWGFDKIIEWDAENENNGEFVYMFPNERMGEPEKFDHKVLNYKPAYRILRKNKKIFDFQYIIYDFD